MHPDVMKHKASLWEGDAGTSTHITDVHWEGDISEEELRKVMKLNRHHSLLKSGRIEQSLQEHRAIMQVLQARNAPLSQQRMQEHFANGLEAAG